jgi:hypothetical protein
MKYAKLNIFKFIEVTSSNIMLYLNSNSTSNNSKFNLEMYMDTSDPIRSGRTASIGIQFSDRSRIPCRIKEVV